jgi:tetratricopeptide (TPR) repeat protein
VTYPNEKVASYISAHFIPVKLNIKESGDLAGKFQANWTPTILCVDQEGMPRHRLIGFLPPDDYLAELVLARGRWFFDQGRYDDAATIFGELVKQFSNSPQAPEAQYWLGVSRYKKSGNRDDLIKAWEELGKRYPGSYWARKVPFLYP